LLTKTNSRGYTPLHSAAYWNTNPEIVQFLLEKGASVTAASKIGQTPVQVIGSRDRSSDVIKQKKEIFENWRKLQPAVPQATSSREL
jgi:ankyrin repeat protein